MPKSACNRCEQNIEYDASYEGHEVTCPNCDNITLLKSNELDRSIPVATPIPSAGATAPVQTAVPAPPASSAQGPQSLPPGVQSKPSVPESEPVPEPEPEVKAVTAVDRIAPPPTDDDDDGLPAKFKPGPRRKVAPARRPARQATASPEPAPPPPPPPAPPQV